MGLPLLLRPRFESTVLTWILARLHFIVYTIQGNEACLCMFYNPHTHLHGTPPFEYTVEKADLGFLASLNWNDKEKRTLHCKNEITISSHILFRFPFLLPSMESMPTIIINMICTGLYAYVMNSTTKMGQETRQP